MICYGRCTRRLRNFAVRLRFGFGATAGHCHFPPRFRTQTPRVSTPAKPWSVGAARARTVGPGRNLIRIQDPSAPHVPKVPTTLQRRLDGRQRSRVVALAQVRQNQPRMPTLLVQCVVGTAEQIRAGEGECAITATQAAARLGVSVSSVRNFMRDGALTPCARFEKTRLFLERDVERLRAEREARQ